MANTIKIHYEKPRKRWYKMIDHIPYKITCKQLGLPNDKCNQEDSEPYARAYFEKIELESRQAKARKNLILEKLLIQKTTNELIKKEYEISSIDECNDETLGMIADDIETVLDQREIETAFSIPPAIPTENQLGTHAKNFLKLITKDTSIATHDQYRTNLEKIVEVFGESFDVSKFSANDVTKYFNAVEKLNIIERGKVKYWAMFKRFLNHLDEHDIFVKFPKLVNSPTLTFDRSFKKKVLKYENSEVIKFIDSLDEYWQLIMLLHLNCAMQTADISELNHNPTVQIGKEILTNPVAVDWENKRIIRSRVKNKRVNDPATVSYLLWDSTFELLQKYKSNDPEYVLLTPDGKKLKRGRTNWIVDNYRDFETKEGIEKIPLTHFRSIGTTAFGDKFHNFKTKYLCNESDENENDGKKKVKVNKITGKHYDAGIQKEFDAAIKYLGKQFNR